MGFTPQRQKYKLVFPADHPLHGLEIRTTGVTVGDLLGLSAAYAMIQASSATGATASTDMVDAVDKLVALFAKALVDWNLEVPAGTPVLPDRDGLNSLDFSELLAIVMAWAKRIAEVADPLGKRSTPSGPTSNLAMLPMVSTQDVPVS